MAVRLYSEFKSDQGDQYKIEIHDSQWLAVATEFNVDSRGFELTYEGETDDIVSPIVGSKLTFGAYAANGTFETFIDTLKLFQENRFRVVVYRSETISGRNVDNGLVLQPLLTNDDETEYRLFWVGWLTQDLVNVEDASAPYIYEITATDGIGRLANFDYDAANVVNETNGFKVSRITDVLKTSFDKIGTSDLWGASDVYFETSADWWETNAQTYSTANDPLSAQGFDVRYFREKDDDGNDVYSSTLEILRQIATLYNARIFMQRGRFVFEQYGNRDTNRVTFRNTITGTHLGRALVSDDVVLIKRCTAHVVRETIGIFCPRFSWRKSITFNDSSTRSTHSGNTDSVPRTRHIPRDSSRAVRVFSWHWVQRRSISKLSAHRPRRHRFFPCSKSESAFKIHRRERSTIATERTTGTPRAAQCSAYQRGRPHRANTFLICPCFFRRESPSSITPLQSLHPIFPSTANWISCCRFTAYSVRERVQRTRQRKRRCSIQSLYLVSKPTAQRTRPVRRSRRRTTTRRLIRI
jgi:hypothetical protein